MKSPAKTRQKVASNIPCSAAKKNRNITPNTVRGHHESRRLRPCAQQILPIPASPTQTKLYRDRRNMAAHSRGATLLNR